MSDNGTSDDAPFFGPGALSSMMDAAAKAQQRWMKGMMGGDDVATALPPLFTEAAKQWQASMQRAADAASSDLAPIAQQTIERAAEGQASLLRVYQLAIEAWQEAMTAAHDGEEVPSVMARYAERASRQMREAVQVWNDATKEQQSSFGQMMTAMQGAENPLRVLLRAPQAGGDGAEAPAAAFLENVLKLFEIESVSERLLDAPALGLSREFNQEVAQGVKAFQEHQRAAVRYQTVVGSIASDAVQRFMTTLGERIQEGEAPETLRDLSTLWTEVADTTFIRAFRTDDYIDAQNDYLETALRLRKQQRVVLEEIQEAFDQPTRSEMEEVYQLLHRLRQENKQLKRDVSDLQDALADAHSSPAGASQDTPAQDEVDALRAEIDALREQVAALQSDVGSAEATSDATPDDLTAIDGIGPATQTKLRDAGLATFDALADATPSALRDALGDRQSARTSDDQIAAWQDAARMRV